MIAGVPLTTRPPTTLPVSASPPARTERQPGILVSTETSSADTRPPRPIAAAAVPTPSVPAELRKTAAAIPKPTPAQQSLISTGVATVVVRPGEANIFPVSAGRPNRIVTPFQRAKVSTEAVDGIEVRGGVVYVTPAGDGPVSMFITEEGDESVALSATLVPSHMPPVHLELQLPPDLVARSPGRRAPQDVTAADKFERGQAYVDMLRTLMRGLALGRVPHGFELLGQPPAKATAPVCAPGPVRVDFSRGQYLRGSRIEVWVGVVANPRSEAVDFVESWCGGAEVMSVALSPSPLVPAGGASEIYIARRIPAQEEDRSQIRPVLVSRGK